MSNMIYFDADAQDSLKKGVKKLCDAVSITMGPRGKLVLIVKNNEPPHLTKDGATVAKSIVLNNRVEDLGAKLLKQASENTATVAGDGSTTSTVLAKELYFRASQALQTGIGSQSEITSYLNKKVSDVIDILSEKSKKVSSNEEIKQVATISANGDEYIGDLIANAMLEVGTSGLVTVEKKVDIFQSLRPINDAMYILKRDLPSHVSLIGFAGAPWTLSCYMIEGKGSKDFIKTRTALWEAKKWFKELIETLIVYVAQKLELQARAGADVLMIFDSWSHMIPYPYFQEFGIKPIAKIIELLRSKKIQQPIIGFPFKAGTSLVQYSYESNVDCIALDWSVDLEWALKHLNSSIVFQGNLDPAALIPENNK